MDDRGGEERREIRVRGGLGERDTKRWEGRKTKFHSVLQDTRIRDEEKERLHVRPRKRGPKTER